MLTLVLCDDLQKAFHSLLGLRSRHHGPLTVISRVAKDIWSVEVQFEDLVDVDVARQDIKHNPPQLNTAPACSQTNQATMDSGLQQYDNRYCITRHDSADATLTC